MDVNTVKPKEFLSNYFRLYVTTITIFAAVVFYFNSGLMIDSVEEWTLVYAFTASILLLNHFLVYIPPKGNSISMDSAIYLACLFLYGIQLTLIVLLLSSLIYAIYKRNISWWKHLFNFSMYCLMIYGAYLSFLFAGGQFGDIDNNYITPYLICLFVYFVINTLLISVYFALISPNRLLAVFNKIIVTGILKESFISYSVSLLLSIALAILASEQGFFGLFLFTILVLLLSVAFNKFLYLYQDVAEKANRDHLTGLYNHGYFKKVLTEKFEESSIKERAFCIALLDIDDFKKYNDSNGHLQGDELLKFFGKLLKDEMEKHHFIVARYGGEEFAVLMLETFKTEAFQIFERFRKKVNDTYFLGVEHIPYRCLSFSCGIVEYETGTYDPDELVHKADRALYYAKAQGKNNVQIYDEENISFDALQWKEDLDAVEQLLKIFLSKDIYTYRHSKRVFKYAAQFSEKLLLSEHEKRTLILGALIHDIGKLEVPRDIINKEGKLAPHEWEIMKKHVTWGREIIATDPRFEELIPLVELHHERFDGNGYPYGLKGEEIPKLARILCIVDSFDAMTTERPYQQTKSFEEAVQELWRCSGKQFDPTYVKPFIDMIEDMYLSGDSPEKHRLDEGTLIKH